MKAKYIIPILLLSLLSCSKEVSENELINEIESFSGLKLEEGQIDSIRYEYDSSFVDEVKTYLLYLNESQLDYIHSQLNDLPNFTNYRDSLTSYSVFENGEVEQVNFIPKRKLIVYSKAHL